jgi:hypothetical protein
MKYKGNKENEKPRFAAWGVRKLIQLMNEKDK